MKEQTKQYHLQCSPGDVGRYCLLPGDPGRCEKIAAHLHNARLVCSNREYTTYTGELCGVPISVVSTGIGGPSAAIAMEELVQLGVHTFVRVGTCGGMQHAVQAGDLVIAQACVRQEGTSAEYAPLSYPATADYTVLTALVQAARKLKAKEHVGVVHCKDSFYGQHAPQSMPLAATLQQHWQAYLRLGVLASEMESAALYTVAATRHVRCGSVLLAVWNQEREAAGLDQQESFDTELVIRCAVEAMRTLIEQDTAENATLQLP